MENIKICVQKSGEWLYKYRWYIAIFLFMLCVIFEISGSSIGMWKNFGMSDVDDDGVILGKSRQIRSDEWAVLTPMTFSQEHNGFKYFSDIIRADKTDVFIVYGLPVFNFMEIFRPFQLGFLFLGLSRGLSFFWFGRIIALFMIMFELFMILTNNRHKLLSFIASTMVTLAPLMQWWFAVCGIAEIFIFGGMAVILLDKYMSTDNFKKRCLCLLGMVICAGGYILVFYPSWQIPIAYVFLILAIWVIVKNRKNCKINVKDIISIIISLIILAGCMTYILIQSGDTIKCVMNTAYPGSRVLAGGGLKWDYFYYMINLFTPYKDIMGTNACERALMIGLYPINLILAIIALIKGKKKDILLILSIVAHTFLSIWVVIGFPAIIAKITLLDKVQSTRAMIAIGFLDIIILVRSIAILKTTVKKINSAIISIILAVVIALICKVNYPSYISIKMAVIIAIASMYLFYFALCYKEKYYKYLFAVGMIGVMVISGATVNPIRRGIDVIYDSSMIKEIKKINNEEKGNWITEDVGFPVPNFILMAGVPVINSTNTYPDLERWYKIDKDRNYEEVYNRYAHPTIKIINNDEEVEDKFKLIQSDVFEVYLTPEELEEIEVKYIVTVDDVERFNTDKYKFDKIAIAGPYFVYKLNKVV